MYQVVAVTELSNDAFVSLFYICNKMTLAVQDGWTVTDINGKRSRAHCAGVSL